MKITIKIGLYPLIAVLLNSCGYKTETSNPDLSANEIINKNDLDLIKDYGVFEFESIEFQEFYNRFRL